VKLSPHAPSAIVAIDDLWPDVIVLDVLLTGGTAFTLLHELQSYGDTGQVPVILCTNMAESLKLEDLERYGVKRIVDKTTMQPDDLVAAVRGVL
jgi:CheY-like chemotaxis protein